MADLERPYNAFKKQLADIMKSDDRVLFALNNLENIQNYGDFLKKSITQILRSGSKTIDKAALKQFLQSVKRLFNQASLYDKQGFDKRNWKISFGKDVRKIRSEAIAAYNMLGELKRTVKSEDIKTTIDVLKGYLMVWADFVRILQENDYV